MADGPRLHFPLLDVNHPLAEPKLGTFRAVVHAHRRFDELFNLQTGLVCETACFFRGWILGERPASADCFHSIFFDQKQPIFSTNFSPRADWQEIRINLAFTAVSRKTGQMPLKSRFFDALAGWAVP